MSLAGALARTVIRLAGWRLIDRPTRPRKAVVIAYPHTSNWDFVWALLGLFALEITPRWAGKDTLFRRGMGPVMRRLGGIPVNRRERTGFVGRMAEAIGAEDDFLLVIAAEGTRSRSEGWKSGFLRIAREAEVPLLLATVDYGKREAGFVGEVMPTGDDAADMAAIAALYAGRTGHRPANASPIVLIK